MGQSHFQFNYSNTFTFLTIRSCAGNVRFTTNTNVVNAATAATFSNQCFSEPQSHTLSVKYEPSICFTLSFTDNNDLLIFYDK